MKKVITLITISLLVLALCVCVFSACTPKDEQNGESQDNTTNGGIKHYEIQLTKENFEEFLDYNVTIQQMATGTTPKKDFYEIKGVLTYAYYKDVTITFYVEYSNSDGLGGTIYYRGNYVVKLNAAGNYSFYTNDEAVLTAINCNQYNNLTTKSLTITAVSGTVIFDI